MISSPIIKESDSVSFVMSHVFFALIPSLLIYIYFFGYGILGNLIFGVTLGVLFEYLCLKLRNISAKPFLLDGSTIVTCWLLIISIPSGSPWWIILIGVFSAIVIAKHIYGGLGSNIFNPAMIGYAILLISFPAMMTNWEVSNSLGLNNFLNLKNLFNLFHVQLISNIDAVSSATPLDNIKTYLFLNADNLNPNNFPNYEIFNPRSIINISYFAGGLYLLHKKIISWHLPITLIITVILFSSFMSLIDANKFMGPIHHLLNGAVILGAFFILTDPVTSPTTKRGKIIFAILIGIITLTIRNFGGYPDGVAFAVIFMNIWVPLIEKFTQPKVFGY